MGTETIIGDGGSGCVVPCDMKRAEEFDAFCARIDRALETQLGPKHQEILSAGRMIHLFRW